MIPSCDVTLDTLIAYRFGELSEVEETRLEDHLFACSQCADRAAFLAATEREVQRLFVEGSLSGAGTLELLRRAEALGLTLRTYRIEPGGSVACTAGPDDDLIVVRLPLRVPEATSVDLEVDTRMFLPEAEETQHQLRENMALDVDAGELIYLFSAAFIRKLPRSRWVMRARVHEPAGTREQGPYTMNHTPWEQRTE